MQVPESIGRATLRKSPEYLLGSTKGRSVCAESAPASGYIGAPKKCSGSSDPCNAAKI